MLFWMRSKTYMTKINLQRGKLTVDNRKSREKKRICSEVSVNSPGNPWSQSRRRNGISYGGKDLQKRKVLSLEWKSEGVMDDESGESMEPMEQDYGGNSQHRQTSWDNRFKFPVVVCADVCVFPSNSINSLLRPFPREECVLRRIVNV